MSHNRHDVDISKIVAYEILMNQMVDQENEEEMVIQYDGFEKAFPPGNYNFASAQNQLILLDQNEPEKAYMVVLCGPYKFFNTRHFN